MIRVISGLFSYRRNSNRRAIRGPWRMETSASGPRHAAVAEVSGEEGKDLDLAV